MLLVFGDARRVEWTAAKARGIGAGLARGARLPPGIERHAALAGLLIEAGELEQGLLDAELERDGEERPSEVRRRAERLTRALAEALLASWRARGAGSVPLRPSREALRALLFLPLPPKIQVKVPEGFSLYGLYPESYLAAGERLGGEERGASVVVGLRSIGTSLAAAVAAALPGACFTLRPVGHPFTRNLAVGEGLAAAIRDNGAGRGRFVLVDEGPGLSGSSLGGAADWLEERGVAESALRFVPGHAGDLGPEAAPRHRERWGRARRSVVSFEETFDGWGPARWVEELTGPADRAPEDLAGGRWRALHFPREADWPAVHLQQERRKLLLRAGGRRWLLKFAGLGRYGEEKLARARALAQAGLAPPVAGVRHGFLVAPWLEDARPLSAARHRDRAALLDGVARYLAFLAIRFPAPPDRAGAPPERLLEMAVFNAERGLGKEEAAELERFCLSLPSLTSLARPALSDNRMHAWEWLATADGRVLKADALDHHAGNDLVGAQDPAWDVAGAVVELELNEEEQALLLADLARRGGPRPGADQLGFYLACYLAFQLGWHALAARALAGAEAEAARLRRAAEGYAARLRAALAHSSQCALNASTSVSAAS